jgi:hypothetical protein
VEFIKEAVEAPVDERLAADPFEAGGISGDKTNTGAA